MTKPTVTIDQAHAISRSAYMHGYIAAIRGDSPNRMEEDAPKVVSHRVCADMAAPKAPEVPAPAQPEAIPPALPWLVAALREAVKTGNTGMLHERLNDMERVIAGKVYPDGWTMAQEAILDLQGIVEGRCEIGCTAHKTATRAIGYLRLALGVPDPENKPATKSEIADEEAVISLGAVKPSELKDTGLCAAMQRRLKLIGWYDGACNGTLDDATKAAYDQFREKHSLVPVAWISREDANWLLDYTQGWGKE